MMATENVGTLLTDLKHRIGAIGVALVGRDGLVAYADLPAGAYAETFSVMCATILGASVTASAELGHGSPERILIEGDESKMVIVACGAHALLVAAVAPAASVPDVVGEMTKFADLLKTG